jgi:hypothetical protein
MRSFCLSWICFLLMSTTAFTQKQYDAKMVIFFKDTFNVVIAVNLNSPNSELITVIEKINETGKQPAAETEKLNSAVITCFFINGERYKFKDLKNGYTQKEILRNCCVQRIAGTDTLGLFEFKGENNEASFYIQTPKDGYELYNIEHDYVTSSFKSFALLRLMHCPFLYDKISSLSSGYFYGKAGLTTLEKVAVWKNIIDAYYNNCTK